MRFGSDVYRFLVIDLVVQFTTPNSITGKISRFFSYIDDTVTLPLSTAL